LWIGTTTAAVFVIQAPDQVRAHWQRVTEMLRKQFPTAVPVMEAARDDVLCQMSIRLIGCVNQVDRCGRLF
jgi:hypothetical protein